MQSTDISTEKSSSNKIIILSIIILVIFIAGTLFFLAKDKANYSKGTNNSSSTSSVSSSSSTTSTINSTVSASACGITQAATAGPYYVSDTPELVNGELNYTNLPGEKIKITGYVYSGSEGTTAIPGAKIEIWQADSIGNYYPEGSGSASQYSVDKIALRGYVVSDSKGYYEFTTIYPGEYEGRVRHIHVAVLAEGYGVVTQFITPSEGDKISPSQDSVAQGLPECNVLSFQNISGIKTASFDFRLSKK